MEYTSKLLIKFLNKLIAFDKNSNAVIKKAAQKVEDRDVAEISEWEAVKSHSEESTKNFVTANESLLLECQKNMTSVYDDDINNKKEIFARIQKCKELLSLIFNAEKSVNDHKSYSEYANKKQEHIEVSVEELIRGNVDFISPANELNYLLRKGKRKELSSKCPYFYALCRHSESILNQELDSLRGFVPDNQDSLYQNYLVIGEEIHSRATSQWNSAMEVFTATTIEFVEQKQRSEKETKNELIYNENLKNTHLQKFVDGFFEEFPPKEMADEYARLYSLEPSYEHYESYKEMPRNIHISTLEYDISNLELSDYTKSFLDRYYYFLYRNNKVCIPYCASFGSEFNYLFRFNGEGRSNVVKNACDLGMRLFMMLPPGKLNFTFIDPVTLGESFAMFTRLVDVDDRTSEVINGKIWSSPADIEQKLKVMTDHISNVTQRCLQGKYDNIYEYNRVAEQNAEAYQVLMLMDFPAGLTDQSLRLLEQIVTSGPKCGVFTVIYRNESQYKKISERSYPLITNIETNFQVFNFNDECTQISCFGEKIKDKELLWNSLQLPNKNQMDKIIAILKKEIKNADKVVIGIDKVSNAESTNTTKDGIRIPIGIHGANEVQYLTLGVGGSHHALIAGVAGSGKSSLLHTIILQALSQYDPDELRIYLVDFKRGVEFKVYADYKLPSFEVVAIESEREFGYNILKALEREQKIRADKFKRVKDRKIDRIENYRALGSEYKMPRILVIMDEFHELFTNVSDKIGKESAEMMERIVRQGRAFGVHIILASQSYSNVGGLDKSVYDQMAVRIVLKCSKTDASLLLGDGSSDVDQISIDDPGRAIYNSEAGNKEYNSHFRVAFIDPTKHRGILEGVSEKTCKLSNNKTRILLSNIEDNKYSIFNQFTEYAPTECAVPGRLYLGEPLSVTNNMNMDLIRSDNSNLLMLGNDTEKARSMFAFSILSLCINYRVKHGKVPEKPFIYLLNCKPLDDSYFKDIPKIIASELLPEYVRYIHCGDESATREVLSELHDNIRDASNPVEDTDKYFFVFGYQRAEELKSETKLSQGDDIDNLFNLMPSNSNKSQLSPKEIFHIIVKDGAKCGVHAILWQDSFSALEQDDNNIMSYFNLKVAFDMSSEEFSRSVGVNDISLMSENNAIYYNRTRDNQKFRPYQAPDEDWLKDISAKLH